MNIFVLLLTVAVAFLAVWLISKLAPVKPVVQTSPVPKNAPEVDKDSWVNLDAGEHAPGMPEHQLDGVELHIGYLDGSGKTTQRDIAVKRYAHNPETGEGVIYAFCFLRQANRTFILRRIQQASDPETGEIIPNIGGYLDAAYQATPEHAVDQFFEQHDAAVTVLFALAKADGAMRIKERAAILRWALKQGLPEPSAPALEALMKTARSFTKHEFHTAVKIVATEARPAPYVQALWVAAQAILLSDKAQHPEELRMMNYAGRHWSAQLRVTTPISLPASAPTET